MAYAIIVTLNRTLENEVRKLWHEFEAAGIGKTPGQFAEPPHITLSVFPTGNPNRLSELVDLMPITASPVRLIPFGTFLGEKHVLYYTAVLSRELLQAHAQHYDTLHREKVEYDPLYSPGSIVFHCTMALDIEDRRFLDGINICLKHRDILNGFAEDIKLIEFFPVNIIHSRRLVSMGG